MKVRVDAHVFNDFDFLSKNVVKNFNLWTKCVFVILDMDHLILFDGMCGLVNLSYIYIVATITWT